MKAKAKSHPLGAAGDGGKAGARDLDQSKRLHQNNELLDLRGLAGDLEDEMLGRGVDDGGAESFGEAKRLDPLLALAGDLDQRKLALDRIAEKREVGDRMHRDQPFQLMLDLLDDHGRA